MGNAIEPGQPPVQDEANTPFRRASQGTTIDKVPALLADKLAQGKISREEHDAILQAHALSTRPTVPGIAESAGQVVPAAAMAPLEVLCTTFNMGNCPLDPATLGTWLGGGGGADVVAISLQETWGSTARAEAPPASPLSPRSSADRDEMEQRVMSEIEAMKAEAVAEIRAETVTVPAAAPGPVSAVLVPSIAEVEVDSDSDSDTAGPGGPAAKQSPAKLQTNVTGLLPPPTSPLTLTPSPSPLPSPAHLRSTPKRQGSRFGKGPRGPSTVDLLTEHLAGYVKTADVVRAQMRLLVFTRRTPRQPVHSIETSAENTGALFGTMPNKGGLVVRLAFGVTSLTFVGCHLCAHEGQQHYTSRNSSCAEILEGARLGNRLMDVSLDGHHCFFIGDLNYRVDFGIPNADEVSDDDGDDKDGNPSQMSSTVPADMSWADKFELANCLIELGGAGWDRLYGHDELVSALKDGLALRGFRTVKPDFPPTFKCLKGQASGYNPKRLPSWCDRVLWSSLVGIAGNLELLEHTSVPQVVSSDHKPVRARFAIKSSLPVARAGKAHTMLAHITELKATGLTEMDGVLQGGMSDPYIEVFSDPAHVHPIGDAKPAQTKVVPKCLNPVWPEPLVVPLNCATVDGVHLFLCVKDRDVGSSDDLIGTACIALKRAEREATDPDTTSAGNPTSEYTPVQSLRKRQQRRRRGALNEAGPALDKDRRHFSFSVDLLNNGQCHGHLTGVCEVITTEVSAALPQK